ncbi:hypothetical protein ACS0TY_002343 [Phlomoides rotata]
MIDEDDYDSNIFSIEASLIIRFRGFICFLRLKAITVRKCYSFLGTVHILSALQHRNSTTYGCLERFVSRNPENLIRNECERRIHLNCQSGDVFLRYSGIKLPGAKNSTINERRMSLSDYVAECSNNCGCTTYTRLNISGEESGCLFYHGDLIDIRTLSTFGQDIYIKMAVAER